VDLARTTMAKLEAGLGTVQNLAGPVPAWEPQLAAAGEGTGFADTPPAPSLWEVDIETLSSAFAGLTHVTVTALKRPAPESDRIVASYSLHQLVRLVPDSADTVGGLDATGRVSMPADALGAQGGGP
jgi:hypothetical protein